MVINFILFVILKVFNINVLIDLNNLLIMFMFLLMYVYYFYVYFDKEI